MAALDDGTNGPTEVTVNLSYKMNLGNYETMDIHIGVKDFARKGEKVSVAFDRVYSFVESRLVSKVEETSSALKSKE